MGVIRDSIGSVVGRTGGGRYGDPYGGYSGKIHDDGTLVDRGGSIVGSIGGDGRIYDRYGNDTGLTHED